MSVITRVVERKASFKLRLEKQKTATQSFPLNENVSNDDIFDCMIELSQLCDYPAEAVYRLEKSEIISL